MLGKLVFAYCVFVMECVTGFVPSVRVTNKFVPDFDTKLQCNSSLAAMIMENIPSATDVKIGEWFDNEREITYGSTTFGKRCFHKLNQIRSNLENGGFHLSEKTVVRGAISLDIQSDWNISEVGGIIVDAYIQVEGVFRFIKPFVEKGVKKTINSIIENA